MKTRIVLECYLLINSVLSTLLIIIYWLNPFSFYELNYSGVLILDLWLWICYIVMFSFFYGFGYLFGILNYLVFKDIIKRGNEWNEKW